MTSSRRFSRRGFLSAGAAAAAAASFSYAQYAPSQSIGQNPAIDALPVLSGLARPFTADERLARTERARGLMGAQKLNAIVLAGNTGSSEYFAGFQVDSNERLWALVIPVKARPFLVCPAFEEGRAREFLAAGPFGKAAAVIVWQEDESPFIALGKGLRDRGILVGRVGLDEEMKFVFAEGIRAACPGLTIVSAAPVTAGCRMIKDAHEIECQRLACRATLLVYRAVAQSIRVGMTSTDVSALVAAAYKRVGFEGGVTVDIDEYTSLPHGSRQPQILREGSIVMLDDGCFVEGYTSDITRTLVLGKATDKMKRVFDLVLRAQTVALHTARPGIPASEVDAAGRKVIVDGGYGPGFKYFTHRLGHGLGLDGHEWPYFVRNNMFGWDTAPRLRAGMTFSDEPGIYIPGEFGIRLEDDLLVTESGAELLTPQSPSLEDPFAGMA